MEKALLNDKQQRRNIWDMFAIICTFCYAWHRSVTVLLKVGNNAVAACHFSGLPMSVTTHPLAYTSLVKFSAQATFCYSLMLFDFADFPWCFTDRTWRMIMCVTKGHTHYCDSTPSKFWNAAQHSNFALWQNRNMSFGNHCKRIGTWECQLKAER